MAAKRNVSQGPALKTADQTATGGNPKWLVPLLVALVLVLVAVVSFMMGKSVGARSATNAPATVEASAPAQDGKSADQAQQPTKAEPITDPKTLEFVKGLPRREANDPRALGPVDAPVVMTMWEDFACPMCTRFELTSFPEIKKLAEEGKIRIEWRDLSIFTQPHHSDLAAIGSRAAAKQGKFWDFVRTAYEEAGHGHPDYTDDLVKQIAQKAGVPDMAQFEKDYKDPTLKQAVDAETQEAQRIGIGGTPAFVVGDAFIGGAYPTDFFLNTINDRLAAAKK
ncbi:hypothetical protein BK816_08845 [Boudabousia tangfeifanii]|uniref:Thioredoxin domain-containing protein n=1 Tax=Boudabousia tangfeifanii TaxID=1912795 RepID=A0A1D9MM44_9ACTO|nr:thioredoxin domain-containing protein [Boudabousia tangfeifanii]AOZ73364.1 hypothetical protein BK816_08845 [Boudabousia tangfeifanii]